MEYYSALRKKEILIHATEWMNPEEIMLNEISQSQQDKYCMIPFIRGIKSSEIHSNSRMMVARGWGKGTCHSMDIVSVLHNNVKLVAQ